MNRGCSRISPGNRRVQYGMLRAFDPAPRSVPRLHLSEPTHVLNVFSYFDRIWTTLERSIYVSRGKTKIPFKTYVKYVCAAEK